MPLGLTFKIEDPDETIVNCPIAGEKNPVEVSVVNPILGADAVLAARVMLSRELKTLILNGAASTQKEESPIPRATSS